MTTRFIRRVAALALLLGSGSAFAISCPDPIGSYNYQGYLTPATDCNFQDGNVTAAVVNGWWPSGWEERDSLGAAGSGAYLTATASPSWGQPPITGTWQISQAFWDTYGEAVI